MRLKKYFLTAFAFLFVIVFSSFVLLKNNKTVFAETLEIEPFSLTLSWSGNESYLFSMGNNFDIYNDLISAKNNNALNFYLSFINIQDASIIPLTCNFINIPNFYKDVNGNINIDTSIAFTGVANLLEDFYNSLYYDNIFSNFSSGSFLILPSVSFNNNIYHFGITQSGFQNSYSIPPYFEPITYEPFYFMYDIKRGYDYRNFVSYNQTEFFFFCFFK